MTFAGVPRLLISVRSPDEARIAATAGVDLIDIKEPRRGSLGFAGGEVIGAIGDVLDCCADDHPPLSAALGELADWSRDSIVPRIPENVAFAKIGLSGCGGDSDWTEQWTSIRNRFDESANRRLNWIAVHYVDRNANSPPWPEILTAARRTGCAGVLLDTFDKARGGLFEHISEDALTASREATRDADLLLAVAGGLRPEDIPRLRSFAPDIIAARGAVCRGGERGEGIDAVRVRELQSTLRGGCVDACLAGKYPL